MNNMHQNAHNFKTSTSSNNNNAYTGEKATASAKGDYIDFEEIK